MKSTLEMYKTKWEYSHSLWNKAREELSGDIKLPVGDGTERNFDGIVEYLSDLKENGQYDKLAKESLDFAVNFQKKMSISLREYNKTIDLDEIFQQFIKFSEGLIEKVEEAEATTESNREDELRLKATLESLQQTHKNLVLSVENFAETLNSHGIESQEVLKPEEVNATVPLPQPQQINDKEDVVSIDDIIEPYPEEKRPNLELLLSSHIEKLEEYFAKPEEERKRRPSLGTTFSYSCIPGQPLHGIEKEEKEFMLSFCNENNQKIWDLYSNKNSKEVLH